MIVSHLGRFSVIFTAKRHGLGWQGCARIKPSLGAPEPFRSSPTFLAASTARTEAGAELGVQKEVMALIRKEADAKRAYTSLAADSGLAGDPLHLHAASLEAYDALDEDAR